MSFGEAIQTVFRNYAEFTGRATRAEFTTLLVAAYAVPIALWAQGLRSAWVLLPLATTMLAARSSG